jgi:hypothetical protein
VLRLLIVKGLARNVELDLLGFSVPKLDEGQFSLRSHRPNTVILPAEESVRPSDGRNAARLAPHQLVHLYGVTPSGSSLDID